MNQSIEGNIVDVIKKRIFSGKIIIENGKIKSIEPNNNTYDHYICPGFVDSHVHVESSMLIPSEFARLALSSGTVAVVSDPHEIANVLGIEGVKFMIENGNTVPLKYFFCAPSCVPATPFETSGAELSASDIDKLMNEHPIIALGEMMNFPGVIQGFSDVIDKLNVSKKHNLPIDGHIPGVMGDDLEKYANFGISTDHECFSIDEALEKIELGMKILIREGSAARNFEALFPLIDKYPEMVMLCTDDSHPDDLVNKGHINKILRMGVKQGVNIFNLLRAATINPIKHYNLPVGILQEGDMADFVVLNNLTEFNIIETYIDGKPAFSNNRILFNHIETKEINNFNRNTHITAKELLLEDKNCAIKVIEAMDGSLLTSSFTSKLESADGYLKADSTKDILHISVLNRYQESKPVNGFINGFGLKNCAIASTVAHDSHNIIAIGTNPEILADSINELIDCKGGIVFVNGHNRYIIPLEFAGLMTNMDGQKVAHLYEAINTAVSASGCKLKAPFMTMSFMALLVIPELKIGDKGLFDINSFDFVDIYS